MNQNRIIVGHKSLDKSSVFGGRVIVLDCSIGLDEQFLILENHGDLIGDLEGKKKKVKKDKMKKNTTGSIRGS